MTTVCLLKARSQQVQQCRPYSSELSHEPVLSEADVEQYAATGRMRLRPAA
jgi:hypothetical protein